MRVMRWLALTAENLGQYVGRMLGGAGRRGNYLVWEGEG